MTQIVQLARRGWPLLALALALGACDSVDPTEPLATSADPVMVLDAVSATPSFARASFGGGIPFGVFHLPISMYGAPYSSSLVNTSSATASLVPYLEAARKAGMRVVVSFVGADDNYKNKNGTFALATWKKRVDAYRGVDFSSYVADGTIIGHYILDEPHDPANWAGHTIPHATVDEMARYSKSIWPAMPTIIRGWPAYLKGYNYRYLDAAWAQYSDRFGPIAPFISQNVRDAKASGLALVVGLNQLQGGGKGDMNGFYRRGFYSMSAGNLKSWGRALLNEPYVCAFLSWAYDSKYMSRSDIKEAMASLAQTARGRSTSSCRGTNGQTSATQPTPPVSEPPRPADPVPPVPVDSEPGVPADPQPVPPAPQPPVAGGEASAGIVLNVIGWSEKGNHYMKLTWSGARGSSVDVYRDDSRKKNTENDRKYVNVSVLPRTRAATYSYRVCEKNTSTCSRTVSVSVK